MDNSHFGTPSKEWTDYSEAHPGLDMDSDGFADSVDFPSPTALRDVANAVKAASSKALFARDGLASKVTVTHHSIPTSDGSSITMREYRPIIAATTPAAAAADDPLPAYVYFHGGGMLLGTADGEAWSCATWAHSLAGATTPAAVLHVCYRHTPEATHPRQHDDAWDAFEWIVAAATGGGALPGVDRSRLVVGGVSAGASLAASVVFREAALARREGRPGRVAAQLLVIPWLVHRDAYPLHLFADPDRASLLQCEASPTLPKPRYDMFTDLCQVRDPRDPLMNVALAEEEELRGTPRTAIVAVGWDMLRDEAFIYAGKLERLGCPTKKHIFPGLPHAFRKYPGLPSSVRWDELMVESMLWCLDDGAEGSTPGDWKIEIPEQYR